MTKERFYEILQEEGLPNEIIDGFWNTRPTDDLDESILRISIWGYLDIQKHLTE